MMTYSLKKLSLLALLASVLFAGTANAACNADPIVFVHGYSGW